MVTHLSIVHGLDYLTSDLIIHHSEFEQLVHGSSPAPHFHVPLLHLVQLTFGSCWYCKHLGQLGILLDYN